MNRPGPIAAIEELAAVVWTVAAAWVVLPGGPAVSLVSVAALVAAAVVLGSRAQRRFPLQTLLAGALRAPQNRRWLPPR